MNSCLIGSLNTQDQRDLYTHLKEHGCVHFARLEAACTQKVSNIFLLDEEELATIFLQQGQSGRKIYICGSYKDTAHVQALKQRGATDYIALPVRPGRVKEMFDKLATCSCPEFVYQSQSMSRLVQQIKVFTDSDASVLITGQTGTGKEVISRYIHNCSVRASGPFIAVNCAAIPEHLLESELFGHEKGAFTGAISRQMGYFEAANKGTLLLDEISEMSVHLQAKLLRVIQEKSVTRLGSRTPIKVDVRLIFTANRDMVQMVQMGTFRQDLYFRINVLNLHIPALKDRREDIEPLARYFLKKYSVLNNRPAPKFAEDFWTKAYEYGWPGNVRELENTMHRSVLLVEPGQAIDFDKVIFRMERAMARDVNSAPTQLTHEQMRSNIEMAQVMDVSIQTLQLAIDRLKRQGQDAAL